MAGLLRNRSPTSSSLPSLHDRSAYYFSRSRFPSFAEEIFGMATRFAHLLADRLSPLLRCREELFS